MTATIIPTSEGSRAQLTVLGLLPDRSYAVYAYDKACGATADAVGTRTTTDHQYGLNRMENAGALLITTEMLIYELLGGSDSAEFKQMLPLIKSLND